MTSIPETRHVCCRSVGLSFSSSTNVRHAIGWENNKENARMNRNVILSTSAAPPIGPYSQAVRVQGNLLFTSGQIPLDASGQMVNGGIAEQTHAVFANLKAILDEAGTRFDQVVKTTVFLLDMAEFAAMNDIYKTYFTGPTPPARSTIQVARLPKDARIEIEVVALVP